VPRPGTVIAVVALVAALGGGAIAAVDGRGEIRSANRALTDEGKFVTILDLDGVGKLHAYCDSSQSHLSMQFKNRSGSPLVFAYRDSEAGFESQVIPDGQPSSFTTLFQAEGSGYTMFEAQLFRDGGGRPVTTLTITAQGLPCRIAAQALSDG